MLESLEIRNYRSCQKTTFPLHPQLSVLIGPNGTGKTNTLKALLLLKKLCSQRHPYQNEKASSECTLKAKFGVFEKNATLTAKIGTYTDGTNDDRVVDSVQNWYMYDFTGSRSRFNVPLVYFGLRYPQGQKMFTTLEYSSDEMNALFLGGISGKVLDPISQIHEYLKNIKYYGASQFTNPSLCPVSIEVEISGGKRRGIRRPRGVHTNFLYDLYSEYKSRNESSYSEFMHIIGPSGIGLIDGLDFKEVQTSSLSYSVKVGGRVTEETTEKILVIPQFKIGSNKLSPNQLSEGTFKTITLLFYLMTESSRLLLIEEPEVCVHHGLLSSIVELIKDYSKEKQVILSTHSDFVVDAVKPENVFMVSRHVEDGTQIKSVKNAMSTKEFRALKTYLEHEGNLGEYWRHGGMD